MTSLMDPFQILGIPRDASDAAVAKAFRRLAREHHPDRNPGDDEAVVRFRRVKTAYDAIRALRSNGGAPPPRPPRRPPPPPTTVQAPASPASARPATAPLDELEARLRRLGTVIDEARARAVTKDVLDDLLDAARWARLHVDVALAFKPQVHPLVDEGWIKRRFTTERAAMQTFAEFRESLSAVPASALDVGALRNLRARLEGLMAVITGWSKRL